MENYLLLLGDNPPDPALLTSIMNEHSTDSVEALPPATVPASRPRRSPLPFSPQEADPPADPRRTLKQSLDMARDAILKKTMDFYGGDKKQAAQHLGIGYSSLCRLLKKY